MAKGGQIKNPSRFVARVAQAILQDTYCDDDNTAQQGDVDNKVLVMAGAFGEKSLTEIGTGWQGNSNCEDWPCDADGEDWRWQGDADGAGWQDGADGEGWHDHVVGDDGWIDR